MFPIETFDPTQLAIIGVLLLPVVSGVTQIVKQSFSTFFVGNKIRLLAIVVSLGVFALYAGVQLAPAPWSAFLTWMYAGLSFALAASGNIDLVKEVQNKSANPLNERVG